MVPADTKEIPGHGSTADVAALKRFRGFMSDLIDAVRKATQSGMSKPDAVRFIKMDQYPEIKPLSRTLGNDVATVYDEIKTGR